MFKFLDLFKKKPLNEIPTIKPTTEHKKDDKEQHELFLVELENILVSSNFFKKKYVIKYKNLYKSYKSFTGKDHSLLEKQSFFLESLTDEAQQFTKREVKLYAKNIILLASQRANKKVMLNRFKESGFQEVTLVFPRNELICETMLGKKKKYNNKTISILKAPIFPLITCMKCSTCYQGITYKPFFK
ncbi:hypothetical protein I6M74_20965 [Acinetobacter bereziniae]|uniref:hypothetical protein n=1 Tax=Acinetobacter bereziniae TaxID=106648 RepID=UPI001901C89A|nr:hypothetical protein [Acinetobacter bereziniae]MBJ8424346.1 hypothetical protein [Acinetobacter bereziniae]